MKYLQSVYLELMTRQSFVYTKCISVSVYLNSPNICQTGDPADTTIPDYLL